MTSTPVGGRLKQMKNIISLVLLMLCVNVFGAGNSQIITAASPLTLTSGVMAIPSATSGRNGYLSSTDWSSFNNKQSTVLTTKGDLLGFSTIIGRLGVGTDGQILTADSASTFGFKWSTGGSSGVTSVGLALPNIFSVSGSPVTTTGTLTGTLATQTANTVFSGPTTGSAATPTFRSLVAADIPSLAASIITSGTIGIANGGTGQATKAPAFDALSPLSALGDVLYGGASGTGTRLAGNTSATKMFLSQTGNGSVSAAPGWLQPAFSDLSGTASLTTQVTGTLPAGNGGTGSAFTAFTGPSASTKTFTLPNADSTILTSNAAVTVAQGGSGLQSLTAYAVLAGGTTSTGNLQQVSGLGSSGNVLTSNGAGALPTWQAASGGVTGPGSSTDRAVATWNSTGGTALRDNSAATVTSAGTFATTALKGLTIGSNGNMAISDSGSTSLASRSSGLDNTCFGTNCMNALTSGTLNTAVGWGNMTGTITGSNNTAIGVGDLTALTSGTGNFAGGYVVLGACTSCTENVAIGTGSLGHCATNTCLNNVCVGTNSCDSASGLNSGGHNVGIGSSALANGGIGSYNICIGDTCNISSTIVSNEFVVGGTTGGGVQNGVFGNGWTNASPSSFSLNATSGSGTNIAGGNFTLNAGRGTGSGVGGDIILKTAPAGSTGTTQGTLAERMRVDTKGNVSVGTAALTTGATDQFLYIPTMPGTPVGTPTTKTGLSPIVIDSTNNAICFYVGAAWKCAVGS